MDLIKHMNKERVLDDRYGLYFTPVHIGEIL